MVFGPCFVGESSSRLTRSGCDDALGLSSALLDVFLIAASVSADEVDGDVVADRFAFDFGEDFAHALSPCNGSFFLSRELGLVLFCGGSAAFSAGLFRFLPSRVTTYAVVFPIESRSPAGLSPSV